MFLELIILLVKTVQHLKDTKCVGEVVVWYDIVVPADLIHKILKDDLIHSNVFFYASQTSEDHLGEVYQLLFGVEKDGEVHICQIVISEVIIKDLFRSDRTFVLIVI